MRRIATLTALLALAMLARAETTPLDTPLAEEQEILITCEVTSAAEVTSVPMFESAREGEKAKGTYHYKLWLPKGYLADPQRRWSCMFIASPGGKASMGVMGPRLKAGGYVVVMLVESKNGPWAPIAGNFVAAHDDVVRRVRIQEGLKFATGLSGGARASSLFVQSRPGFSGVILQAAGFYTPSQKDPTYGVAGLKKLPGFAVAMTMGETDSNKSEAASLKAALPGTVKYNVFPFAGGHTWAPAELFDSALTWMERQIYLEGPPRPELKLVYVTYFRQQHAGLATLTAPWERYKLADSLLKLAQARGLVLDPAVGPSVRELQAEVLKLRAEPTVAREAMAADAWRRLREAHRTAPATKQSADAADFAKRYPGTEAAKIAGATGK